MQSLGMKSFDDFFHCLPLKTRAPLCDNSTVAFPGGWDKTSNDGVKAMGGGQYIPHGVNIKLLNLAPSPFDS